MGIHYDTFSELEQAAYKSAGAQGKKWSLLNEQEKQAIDSFCCSNIDSCSAACKADPGAQKYVNRNSERYNTFEKRQQAGQREFLDDVDDGSGWGDWDSGGAGAGLGMRTRGKSQEKNPISDYLIFDLGKKSNLEPISKQMNSSFRVTDYHPDKLDEKHRRGVHKYVITKDLFEADLIITIPKIKTHQKSSFDHFLEDLLNSQAF